jgi:hypothetical protein
MNDMPAVVRHAVRTARHSLDTNPESQFPGSFFPNEVAKLYNCHAHNFDKLKRLAGIGG